MIGLQTSTTDMLLDQCACALEVETRDWLTDQNDRRADVVLISAHDGTSFKKPGGRGRCLNLVNLIKSNSRIYIYKFLPQVNEYGMVTYQGQ